MVILTEVAVEGVIQKRREINSTMALEKDIWKFIIF